MQPQWSKNVMKDFLFTKVRTVFINTQEIRECCFISDLRDWSKLIAYFHLLSRKTNNILKGLPISVRKCVLVRELCNLWFCYKLFLS